MSMCRWVSTFHRLYTFLSPFDYQSFCFPLLLSCCVCVFFYLYVFVSVTVSLSLLVSQSLCLLVTNKSLPPLLLFTILIALTRTFCFVKIEVSMILTIQGHWELFRKRKNLYMLIFKDVNKKGNIFNIKHIDNNDCIRVPLNWPYFSHYFLPIKKLTMNVFI